MPILYTISILNTMPILYIIPIIFTIYYSLFAILDSKIGEFKL